MKNKRNITGKDSERDHIHTVVFEPAVKNISRIVKFLNREYPEDIHTVLKNRNAFQLLVATILSAQSTDKLVNKVTPQLFKKYRTPEDFARVDIRELENDIRSTGFYHNKARNIINCAKDITTRFGGKMPDNIEDLTSLHGVGRKTANVVLANVFGRQAIIVDTHVKRISNRLGLTVNSDPVKIEFDLMKIIPEKSWSDFSHRTIAFGRTICIAKKPKCPICGLLKYCRYGQENT
ncbi:MAG TPA: endonuclease III [Candidatus Humimicrobiaceae bacterium]|nr:endonuclease III [Candidatus Humimicrobiaceae bacterium]